MKLREKRYNEKNCCHKIIFLNTGKKTFLISQPYLEKWAGTNLFLYILSQSFIVHFSWAFFLTYLNINITSVVLAQLPARLCCTRDNAITHLGRYDPIKG